MGPECGVTVVLLGEFLGCIVGGVRGPSFLGPGLKGVKSPSFERVVRAGLGQKLGLLPKRKKGSRALGAEIKAR